MVFSYLKKIPQLTRIVHYWRRAFGITPESLNIQFHKKRSDDLIRSYLDNNKIVKIQIGAQSNGIDGWLNLDLIPKSKHVVYMDATKPFRFLSDSVDYIFTEHMVEHISFDDCRFMLKECFRVLKPGGRIRISTPNLKFLIDLYRSDKTVQQQNYIKFSTQRYLHSQVPMEDVYVINNFFRDWGHKFIHDQKSLEFLLKEVGFDTIENFPVMKSDDINLQNLEQHGNEIGDFNTLESIVVEAQKN